jgi:hypothetical protein
MVPVAQNRPPGWKLGLLCVFGIEPLIVLIVKVYLDRLIHAAVTASSPAKIAQLAQF